MNIVNLKSNKKLVFVLLLSLFVVFFVVLSSVDMSYATEISANNNANIKKNYSVSEKLSENIDGVEYLLEKTPQGNIATVKFSPKASGDIELPEIVRYEHKEYKLVSIGDVAFAESMVTSVKIPNTVKSIGKWAFSKCEELTKVVIPNSVTNIEDGIFHDCEKLTSVNIPNKITKINDDMFNECEALESITIPESVKSIGKSAFFLTGLKDIVIPASVEYIGSSAFDLCFYLGNITFKGATPKIAPDSFSDLIFTLHYRNWCGWDTSLINWGGAKHIDYTLS